MKLFGDERFDLEDLRRQRLTVCTTQIGVTDLATDLECLAVVVQVAISNGDHFLYRRNHTDEVEHRALADLGRRTQRQTGNGPQVVFELAALGAFSGPVPGVVHTRGDFVGLETTVDFKELERHHADVFQLLEHTAGVILSQGLQRVIGAGYGQLENAAVVGVVNQWIKLRFTIASTHGDQRDFTGERHEAFQQAGDAAEFGEGADHVLRFAQDFLTLAVVTQGAGFQHGRQTDRSHGSVQIRLRLNVGERRGRNPQVLEHALLEPAITGNAQGFGARVDRDELRQERHGFGRDALELEGHQIDFIGQLTQVVLIAVIGPQMLAQRGCASIRRRVQESEVHAQRSTRQRQHAAQLAATDYTDLHRQQPQAMRESGLSRTLSVCSARKVFSTAWNCGCLAPRMLADNNAALIAPALPMARVATGMPAGICTMDSSESTPESIDDCTGTPSTGRWVLAAHMPGRCAAPPAPAMITSMPRDSASSAYWNSKSGVRWAETTFTSYGMPSFSSISAVWLRVDQSDLEPMITPTSALIVVPLIGRPQARQKTTSHAGDRRGLLCELMAGRAGQRPRSIPQSARMTAPLATICLPLDSRLPLRH